MTKIVVALSLFCSVFVKAQTLTIVENDSGLPIEGISVSNKDKSIRVFTNNDGKVEISSFSKNSDLYVHHCCSYVKLKTNYKELFQKDFLLGLNKVTEKLEEVVLSLSKGKENLDRIAEQTVIFTAKGIQKISAQTSADLLAFAPGVKVQKTQLGGGSPVLRGMESNRVLLVIDGVRLNNAIYRKGHLQNTLTIAPSMLDRVEVIFGPASMSYGSDALGGVIHYYTKNLKTAQSKEVSSSLFTRLNSANNEFTTQFDTEVSFKKWAFYTNISFSDFGDLRMGSRRSHGFDDWGKVFEYSKNTAAVLKSTSDVNSDPNVQRNTGYSQKDFLQKIYIPVSNDTEFVMNFQYSESSHIPRFDKLTEKTNAGDLKFAEWSYGPQKRLLFSTQIALDQVNNWIDKGTITMAYQDIKESRIQRNFSNVFERSLREEKVKVLSCNADFSVALTERSNRILTYGLEAVYNKVHSNATGENLQPAISGHNASLGLDRFFDVQTRYPNEGSDYSTQAIYIGYRQDIDSKNTLNTGIRLTNTQLNALWTKASVSEIALPNEKISLRNTAATATVGHIYKPSNFTKISMVLSSGFRSPNIDDIGKIREKNGSVTVPNVNLKPEYAYNLEIGVRHTTNDSRFRLGFNAHNTILNNYIIRAPFDIVRQREGSSKIQYEGEEAQVFANTNRGSAAIRGGTFDIRRELNEHWIANASLTYTEGRTLDTKEPLSSIPPLFGNVSIGYKKNRLQTTFHCIFNAAKKVEHYNLSEGIDNIEQTPIVDENATTLDKKYAGTPEWSVLNCSFDYELRSHIDLQIKVDNIFDQHYKEFASAISAPGRNYSASVRYLF
jgi:hemoglobin/transferrin/lactoferrin receptor protein